MRGRMRENQVSGMRAEGGVYLCAPNICVLFGNTELSLCYANGLLLDLERGNKWLFVWAWKGSSGRFGVRKRAWFYVKNVMERWNTPEDGEAACPSRTREAWAAFCPSMLPTPPCSSFSALKKHVTTRSVAILNHFIKQDENPSQCASLLLFVWFPTFCYILFVASLYVQHAQEAQIPYWPWAVVLLKDLNSTQTY